MSVPSNQLPLLSVKAELDSSLAAISRNLESFFSTRSNLSDLKEAQDELHRVKGVLQMLLMNGLGVFCGELETLLQDLYEHPDNATPMRQDAAHRALFGLTHYLDAMAAGAPNAALRLFNEYQELQQARGVEMAFEVDLFFPDLQVELPAPLLNEPILEDAATHIKNSRMQYQQNLLKWLRQEEPMEALRGMMAAVRVVLSCVAQDNRRAFWWVAGGLLNCVLHEGVPPELNVKKALSRIDQRMRALLENAAFDEEAALSEMLYLVARSHTVSKTVENIKQVFDLETYLPEAPPLPPSETTALLNNMRAQLQLADETWEQCVADDAAARTKFAEIAEQLYLLSEQLDRNTLQFLSKQIRTIAVQANDSEHVQRISVDMAMALLLLGSGLDHYQHLGSGFHEQTRILSMRLQAGVMRMPEDASKLDNLVSLYCEMEQREVMSPLAKEMQSNLQLIEQGLNAFFGNIDKRSELQRVSRLMSQVQGGLHILSLDAAEQLLSTLSQITARYQQGDTPSAKEMRTVASVISVLEEYVQGLALGQKPGTHALTAIWTELNELGSSEGQAPDQARASVPEESVIPAGVSIRSGNEDAELLEIFMEEAQEVMETLRSNIEVARLHLESRDPWVTIRRAFHTLKGSGRMVGLADFGEVAWAVERAMNAWLAKNVPANTDLLEMVGDAEVLFQHWVDMLKSGSTTAHIDTSHLLAMADCVETGKPLPQPVAPAAPVAEKKAEPAPAAEEAAVQIGSVSMAPTLFRIASEEAAERVTALQTHLADLQKDEAHIVSYDFMRAAHTLAGVNRTMGFLSIAELSNALEQWLEARIDKPGVVTAVQLTLLGEVLTRLDTMCAAVRNLQEPQAQPELNARLMADKLAAAPSEAPAATPSIELEMAPAGVPAAAVQPLELEMPSLEMPMATKADQEAPAEKARIEQTPAAAPAMPFELDMGFLGTPAAAEPAAKAEAPAEKARIEQAPAAAPAMPFELDMGFLGTPAAAEPAAKAEAPAEKAQIEQPPAAAPAMPFDLDMGLLEMPAAAAAPVEKPPIEQVPTAIPEISFESVMGLLGTSAAEAVQAAPAEEIRVEQAPLEAAAPAMPLESAAASLAVPEAAEVVAESGQKAVAASAPVEKKTEPAAEEVAVQIGSVSMSPMLFRIASEEAAERVAALQKLFADMQKDEAHVVTYDFMRAAHTLAGINRTMGFLSIAELSYALEQWLDARVEKRGIVTEAQLALLNEVLSKLDSMCTGVRNLQEPQAQPELYTRLTADKQVVAASEAPAATPAAAPDLGIALAEMPAVAAAAQPIELAIPALELPAEAEAAPAEKIQVEQMPAEAVAPAMPFELDLGFPGTTAAAETAAEAAPVIPPPEMPAAAEAVQAVPVEKIQLEQAPVEAVAPAMPFELDLGFPGTAAAAETATAAAPAVAAEKPQIEQASPAATLPVTEKPVAAEPAPETPHVMKERRVQDDVDEQLLPIFLEEAADLYPQIGRTLRAWREQPKDAQTGHSLQRSLHTLKGSARMAGAMRLGELTHRVEDRVNQAIAQSTYDEALWSEMDNYLDRIGNAIEQLQHPQQKPAAEAPAAPGAVAPVIAPAAAVAAAPATLDIGAERAMHAALLRVRSDTVDRLVNEAGEVSVARSRAEMELREFKSGVLELTESVNRLRKLVREIEIHAEGQMQARVTIAGDSAEKFDPLEFDRFTRFQELTRFMNESVHDVQTVQQNLLLNLADAEVALNAQAQLNRDLQQGLMNIRMVPFSSISERLYRIVRQTGKELGKRANLELSGGEIELDRSVLEKMTAPFEHLLRNSIAHGLEATEQRQASGKPPIGEIRLSLRQESNEVVFELKDDGRGLDIPRIRQKALESGAISADEEVSDEQAMQLIFAAGLSTSREITEISGRGVGLDVVRSEISSLGGRIDVTTESGHGVKFIIHLPLTLAVTNTLMVSAAQATYALPSTMVENVQQVRASELDELYQQHYIDWQGNHYNLYYLPRLLGDEEAEVVNQPHNPVLLLRSGENRIALHVDALLGNQEVVVKNIGPQLARHSVIAGATVSGSGEVILIINPIAFTQRVATVRKVVKAPAAPVEEVRSVPLVMVVDDSLTVRKITTRLLERTGYQVVTAKDGVDALEQLAEISPSIMLLDVEMPRMDGFELAKRVRSDSKTKAIPIIMITSRTAEKHRNYAMELGVNEYLGKPYQDEELLQHIARFVGAPK